MMSLTVVVKGNLKSDGTLELEQKPDMAPGPVRVTLQPLATVSSSARNLIDVLNEIHTAQKASGFKARSREVIDAEFEQMRAEWDEQHRAIERSQE